MTTQDEPMSLSRAKRLEAQGADLGPWLQAAIRDKIAAEAQAARHRDALEAIAKLPAKWREETASFVHKDMDRHAEGRAWGLVNAAHELETLLAVQEQK